MVVPACELDDADEGGEDCGSAAVKLVTSMAVTTADLFIVILM